MGLYRVERLKQDYDVEVEWKAFELRLDIPREGQPRPPKSGDIDGLKPITKSMADEIHVTMKRPGFYAHTRLAFEATEYAKEQLKFDEFHLGMFKAYWEKGLNIGLVNVIRDVAVECGLDGDELERCLKEGWYTGEIGLQNEEARALGIDRTPSFIIGNCLARGVAPYEQFQKLMETVRHLV
ncbi:DsbA family protein [Chloroflexota bacterium]